MTFDRSGTTDFQRRFLELTLAALEELESTTPRPGFAPLFRVWDYSPHVPFHSWLVQVPRDGNPDEASPIVLERAWQAPGDRDRISRDLRRRPRLEPTLHVREATIPADEFAFLREVASRIPFPLLELREDHRSVQPAQYGIEGFKRDTVRLRSERVRLEWGGAPPQDLKAVAAWAAQMRQLCTRCFSGGDISLERAAPTGHCCLCRRFIPETPSLCPSCGVRYHFDCWNYLGRCAVYGCPGAISP